MNKKIIIISIVVAVILALIVPLCVIMALKSLKGSDSDMPLSVSSEAEE